MDRGQSIPTTNATNREARDVLLYLKSEKLTLSGIRSKTVLCKAIYLVTWGTGTVPYDKLWFDNTLTRDKLWILNQIDQVLYATLRK